MKTKLAINLTVLCVLCFVGCFQEGFIRKQAICPTILGAIYVGNESCSDCHDNTEDFQGTIHGRIADFEVVGLNKGCESCHGPGSIHVESEDPADILNLKNMPKGQVSAVCLECHTSGTLMEWQGSDHAMNDVSCIDCHQVHSQKRKLLAKSEPKLCNDCHLDIRAKTLYPSHHPIKEGKMVCSDCHQAHGSSVSNLKTDERVNDLCLNCHSAKQGPFIFEHEPVVEDCTICHDPHGTVANNLLLQNEPFLCLQCHQMHFHAGKISEVGSGSEPAAIDRSIAPTSRYSFRMAYTTKCTQCHSQVHGSDLPSQSVPSQGRALTR